MKASQEAEEQTAGRTEAPGAVPTKKSENEGAAGINAKHDDDERQDDSANLHAILLSAYNV